eukprot:8199403-Alexandrium_andersonii.AAC.1
MLCPTATARDARTCCGLAPKDELGTQRHSKFCGHHALTCCKAMHPRTRAEHDSVLANHGACLLYTSDAADDM